MLINALTASILIRSCLGEHPPFFSYQPRTEVSDHAAIDRDQHEIINELNTRTPKGFHNAERVYNEGGHSMPYASITLENPPGTRLPAGTNATGFNSDNDIITGTLLAEVGADENEVWVLYDTLDQLEHHASCRVGGSSKPRTKGCLMSEGLIQIGSDLPMKYSYDPMTQNHNARKFAQFSTEADRKMLLCSGCPYEDFLKFYEYYGNVDYADQWVRSAFDGLETNYKNGNADFSGLPREGRVQAIRTGTVFMNLWMYIIREMEFAIDTCIDECDYQKCDEEKTHAWDQAAAFYVGSLEQKERGYLLYQLAQENCKRFKTCFKPYANKIILNEFTEGQENLLKGRCDEARRNKENIVKYMKVPLIQETIRHAHALGVVGDNRTETLAAGASFAATVLPYVYSCSLEDADIIYNNFQLNKYYTATDYKEVKAAFERNYACMGVSCNAIGGLIDRHTGLWMADSFPCREEKKEIQSHENRESHRSKNQLTNTYTEGRRMHPGIVFLISFIVILSVFALTGLVVPRIWKRRKQAEVNRNEIYPSYGNDQSQNIQPDRPEIFNFERVVI